MTRIDPVEEQLFLEGVFLKYGYDFRQYAASSLNRRLENVLTRMNAADPMDLLKMVLRDRAAFERVLTMMTVTTTEAFRDPPFFRALRDRVVPILRTYPTIKIWTAGCSTGEELYSLAILLSEEGLLERSTIFATDINTDALKIAREGIYPVEVMQTFTKNYADYGGRKHPSDYYTADYGFARFDRALKENVVFSEHNLATDNVFTEAHLVICRNVLIYFNRELQDRALGLFSRSLVSRGFLVLGSRETVRFSGVVNDFDVTDSNARIFQKSTEASARDAQPRSIGRRL